MLVKISYIIIKISYILFKISDVTYQISFCKLVKWLALASRFITYNAKYASYGYIRYLIITDIRYLIY